LSAGELTALPDPQLNFRGGRLLREGKGREERGRRGEGKIMHK